MLESIYEIGVYGLFYYKETLTELQIFSTLYEHFIAALCNQLLKDEN
jgi:hypothetical protein